MPAGGSMISMQMVEASLARLTQRGAWLTRQGTLTETGVQSLLSACQALELHPRECASDILAGDPPFDGINQNIRREANLLFRNCEGSDSVRRCRTEIETARFVRDLPVGKVAPSPTNMKENQPTTFTAFIERTDEVRTPGIEGIPDADSDGFDSGNDSGTGGSSSSSFVEYTRETCFRLEAGEDFRIAGENPQCPAFLRSGRHVFAPRWTVTPLDGEVKRELGLTLILKRDGEVVEEVPVDPFPIEITVELEPTLAQKVRTWLTEWTGVAEGARDFVLAVEALVLAIAGMSIWGWLRRRKKKASESDPEASAAAPPAP